MTAINMSLILSFPITFSHALAQSLHFTRICPVAAIATIYIILVISCGQVNISFFNFYLTKKAVSICEYKDDKFKHLTPCTIMRKQWVAVMLYWWQELCNKNAVKMVPQGKVKIVTAVVAKQFQPVIIQVLMSCCKACVAVFR